MSMLEAIERFEELYGRKLEWEYVEQARQGDHICYISDLARLRADYPEWELTLSLDDIFDRFAAAAAVG
jgi:CDP-paratose 2-epimerase